MEELISLLGAEFDVIASATNGRVALDLIGSHKPDVVVLDLSMPELNGIRVAEESAKLSPSPRVVLCSILTDLNVMEAAREAGASGYIVKARVAKDLLPAVRTALQGKFFASPAVAPKIPEKPQWALSGAYLETCNCDMRCPRISLSPPTITECTAMFAWQIEQGIFDETDLSGLNVAAAMYSPRNSEKWRLGVYVDDRATSQQRDALGKIFTGEAGGHLAHLANEVSVLLGVRSAAIEFRADERSRHLRISGIADLDIEAVRGYSGHPITLTNHPLSAAPGFPVELGKAKRLSYSDHGLKWNVADASGFFAPFSYHGTSSSMPKWLARPAKITESNWNRIKRRFAEPGHREIRRANLDRLGRTVLESMSTAGDTPLPEQWRPMIGQINMAHRQNPEHLVLVLWRLLSDFSLKMAKRSTKKPIPRSSRSN